MCGKPYIIIDLHLHLGISSCVLVAKEANLANNHLLIASEHPADRPSDQPKPGVQEKGVYLTLIPFV